MPDHEDEENREEEDDESEDEESEDTDTEQQPGFSFSKSAIADLPSTAVQSIHIENDTPKEVADEVFVWHDITVSGTKLTSKTKVKKQDAQKTGKQALSSAVKANKHTPKTSVSTGKSKPTGPVASKQITSKKNVKQSGNSNALGLQSKVSTRNKKGSQTKEANVESKSRVKERRPSTSIQGKSTSKAQVTKRRCKTSSKTKTVQSREKKPGSDNNQKKSQ